MTHVVMHEDNRNKYHCNHRFLIGHRTVFFVAGLMAVVVGQSSFNGLSKTQELQKALSAYDSTSTQKMQHLLIDKNSKGDRRTSQRTRDVCLGVKVSLGILCRTLRCAAVRRWQNPADATHCVC